MSKTPRHADRDLFFQVLGTIAMCVLAFVEMAFGQFPVTGNISNPPHRNTRRQHTTMTRSLDKVANTAAGLGRQKA